MFRTIALIFCTAFTIAIPQSYADQGPDAFFRPVTSKDLITFLAPRTNKDKLLDSYTNEDFLSFDGSGCPDNIYIGSIEDEADITGNVDINVNIDGDIYIKCGL